MPKKSKNHSKKDKNATRAPEKGIIYESDSDETYVSDIENLTNEKQDYKLKELTADENIQTDKISEIKSQISQELTNGRSQADIIFDIVNRQLGQVREIARSEPPNGFDEYAEENKKQKKMSITVEVICLDGHEGFTTKTTEEESLFGEGAIFAEGPKPASKLRILLVDDDQIKSEGCYRSEVWWSW